jgi:hypothetical protein
LNSGAQRSQKQAQMAVKYLKLKFYRWNSTPEQLRMTEWGRVFAASLRSEFFSLCLHKTSHQQFSIFNTMFPIASDFSSQESSVKSQRSSTAPVQNIVSLCPPTGTAPWPANQNASRAIQTLLLARLVNTDAHTLQQIKTKLMLKAAIEKEKNRLVGSIIMQYKQTATPVTQPQQLPVLARHTHTQTHQIQPTVLEPSATSLVDHIGSQVRVGRGYVDVTKLAGIDIAEAVKPRTNRGGHIETFPEVSAKQNSRFI